MREAKNGLTESRRLQHNKGARVFTRHQTKSVEHRETFKIIAAVAEKVDSILEPKLAYIVGHLEGRPAFPKTADPDKMRVGIVVPLQQLERQWDEQIASLSPIHGPGCAYHETIWRYAQLGAYSSSRFLKALYIQSVNGNEIMHHIDSGWLQGVMVDKVLRDGRRSGDKPTCALERVGKLFRIGRAFDHVLELMRVRNKWTARLGQALEKPSVDQRVRIHQREAVLTEVAAKRRLFQHPSEPIRTHVFQCATGKRIGPGPEDEGRSQLRKLRIQRSVLLKNDCEVQLRIIPKPAQEMKEQKGSTRRSRVMRNKKDGVLGHGVPECLQLVCAE